VAAIADDSGISVDALGGEPGIHSARYAGTRNDADNLALLIERMSGVENRAASFTCAAAFVDAETEHVETAIWPGVVRREASGGGGFGYDPIFQPDGIPVSAAELSSDEKNAISHRALAFGSLLDFIHSR
jgi:XTP/dITP diphosphohydrolase